MIISPNIRNIHTSEHEVLLWQERSWPVLPSEVVVSQSALDRASLHEGVDGLKVELELDLPLLIGGQEAAKVGLVEICSLLPYHALKVLPVDEGLEPSVDVLEV